MPAFDIELRRCWKVGNANTGIELLLQSAIYLLLTLILDWFWMEQAGHSLSSVLQFFPNTHCANNH